MGYIVGLDGWCGGDDDVPEEAYEHFIEYLVDSGYSGHIDVLTDDCWEEWWEENKGEYECGPEDDESDGLNS